MRKTNDIETGEQCISFKNNVIYLSFESKANLIKKNLEKMPLTKEQKQLVERWIYENYTHYVNNAYDYALLVNIDSHNTLKGKMCLHKLTKSFKAYEQEKAQSKVKEQKLEKVIEM